MKKVLGLLFITSSVLSMQLDRVDNNHKSNKMYIDPFSVRVPNRLGSLDLYHSKASFYVRHDDKKHEIKKYYTDPMLQGITKKQLRSFLTAGYLVINQMDDGEYSLRAKGRLLGSGPILGTVAYWVTKSLCYGTAVAAVGTITVAGGGVIGAAVGAGTAATGLAVGGTAVATTATTAIATTAGVVTGTVATGTSIAGGATIVAGAITGAGLAGEAAIATTAVVTGAGSVAATIAGVEAFSVAVGSFFGMLPTP